MFGAAAQHGLLGLLFVVVLVHGEAQTAGSTSGIAPEAELYEPSDAGASSAPGEDEQSSKWMALEMFEPEYRLDEVPLVKGALRGGKSAHADGKCDIDLRVAKGMGSRGYLKLRISAITYGDCEFVDFAFNYSAPFRYRWKYGFDMGRAGKQCDARSASWTHIVASEPDCLKLCSDVGADCAFYTYSPGAGPNHKTCVLASSKCTLETAANTTVTYQNLGRRYLHTSIVDATPGWNEWSIGGNTVRVNVPQENAGTSGIIFADPGYSSRFIGAEYGKLFDVFNRTIQLWNAVGEDEAIHFLEVLGDNWYDQDGRITKNLYDRVSLNAKSKVFQTVVGNHDLWVHTNYDLKDQMGNGFMQFYAQDTFSTVGHEKTVFDFSHDPDQEPKAEPTFFQSPDNFMWYHKMGNVGFVGISNAVTRKQAEPKLREACAYFAMAKPAYIFLLGHWHVSSMGAAEGMATSAARDWLTSFAGCDIGDRVKFFVGHEHCNQPVQHGKNEEVGFMVGARGMNDLTKSCKPASGFTYVETSASGAIGVYYFEEGNETVQRFDEILACIKSKTIKKCTHLATVWLESAGGYHDADPVLSED